MGDEPLSKPPHRSRMRRVARIAACVLVLYLAVTYALVPLLWKRYFHRHPSLEDLPDITYTGDGHPGDPLNVALIGTNEQVQAIMKAAGWYRADALSLHSDMEIAVATVLGRPYVAAPVSNLYLFGRKEGLAFEQPIGNDPRKRNHVRFWKTDRADPDGRPVWIGSATYDHRVGFSYTTGQITHHIGADVDKERDHLFHDLEETKDLSETYDVPDFHKTREGRNGGGDPWHTDGKLYVGVIKPDFH
jgi:LssY C-terminus